MLRLGETRHGSTTGGNPVAHLRSRSGESRPHGSRYRNADEGRDRPRGRHMVQRSLRDPRCTCSKRMRRFHWRGSRLRSGADSCAAGSAPVSNGTFRTPWRSLQNRGSREPSGTFGDLRVLSSDLGYLRIPSGASRFTQVSSSDLGYLRMPSSDLGNELLTRYKQPVNNLLITC